MSQLTASEPVVTDSNVQGSASSTDPGSDSGGRKLERQLFLALLGGTLLLVGGLAKLISMSDMVSDIPAALGAILLLLPLLRGAAKEILRGAPSGDALAALAVLAAIAVNQLLTAGFLALFLWLSKLILSRTAWGAQRARNSSDFTMSG